MLEKFVCKRKIDSSLHTEYDPNLVTIHNLKKHFCLEWANSKAQKRPLVDFLAMQFRKIYIL